MALDYLDQLPDELITAILRHVPPRDTAIASLTCRHIHKVANEPLLWKAYCQDTFDYWFEGDVYSLPSAAVKSVDQAAWKKRFVARVLRDGHNMHLFEDLLQTQQTRIARMEEIAKCGYEAREMLTGYINCPGDADDVLARRFWAEAILARVHRRTALDIWQSLGEDKAPDLEKSLAAFDLFVLGSRKGDLTDVSKALDDIAHNIKQSAPDFDQMQLDQKLLTIVGFLRSHELVGNRNTQRYHGIENNFIGIALLSDEHNSLPLQSTAIFISVARRLGVVAHFCNFPSHIYTMVPVDQESACAEPDGSETNPADFIYLDPWAQSGIVGLNQLHGQLAQMAIPTSHYARYLQPAQTRDIVFRSGRNILTSWESTRRRALAPYPAIETDSAFYGFTWSMLLIVNNEPRETNMHRRQGYLPYLLEAFERHYQEDVGLVEHYLARAFHNQRQLDEFFQLTRAVRARDANAKPIASRADASADKVSFRVGQVFQHKRYGYVGVVVGWTPNCQAREEWMLQMAVDSLPRGRGQSFYHVV